MPGVFYLSWSNHSQNYISEERVIVSDCINRLIDNF